MVFQPAGSTVTRLIGVYDADGGLLGEARYVVGHLLGRLECALCDITHGPLGRRKAFDRVCARLGIPFDVVHRNERSTEIAIATGDALPCVVGVTDAGIVMVLGREDLRACAGDVDKFEEVLGAALGVSNG